MANLESITSSKGYYACTMEAYSQTRQHRESFEKCLKENTSGAMGKVWPRARSEFLCLSVGCGNGKLDVPIVTAVAEYIYSKTSRKVQMYIRALDPSKDALLQYKTLLHSESLLKAIKEKACTEFEFCETTFQSYVAKVNAEGQEKGIHRFDLVNFGQSLYYMEVKTTLVYTFHHLLGDSGVIMCTILAPDALFCKIARILREKYGEEVIPGFCTSADVIKVAQENCWDYEEFKIENRYDMTDILDKNSTAGNMALDFLTHLKDFRATADPDMIASVVKLIKSLSHLELDGKQIITYCNALVIIYKGDTSLLSDASGIKSNLEA